MLYYRILFVHGFLGICLLIIVARLIELQLIRGNEFRTQAQSQHYGGVVLPARRGEILSVNSKTGEQSILATNTTLDMVYVDPLITDDPILIAETLADILLTEEFHNWCIEGSDECPREFLDYYVDIFDPMLRVKDMGSGAILEPLPEDQIPLDESELPSITEIRRKFARDIESRISGKRVRYVPLVYSATKMQMNETDDLNVRGIAVSWDNQLIYADPEQIDQLRLPSISKKLGNVIDMDPSHLQHILRSRPLRYISIMHHLPLELSLRIKNVMMESYKETDARRKASSSREEAQAIKDPLRSIVLIPEHWRFYPDGTVASQVVGFLNTNQEAQYGIERTFNPQLRGQEGRISAVSDPTGGQIVTAGGQSIVDPKDGDTVVLTIDRFVQKEVEKIIDEAVKDYDADSGQAIVMDPETGRIIAMANAPIFDSNSYGSVFEKEPIVFTKKEQDELVVEIYHPDTNKFVLRGYIDDVFTSSGRTALSEEKQRQLDEIEELYNLDDVARYYFYIGENSRREVFKTERDDIWLKYLNNLGVGAYLNRNVQEIYEPGSVFKPITMAIALDQGEIVPNDLYQDNEPVKVDEYTIRNALNNYFGEVTMINCLEYSINTCMTSVSGKLGRKLFRRMIERFGFGQITGIELEDELPGEVLPWKNWSNALLATAAYGQGISATPIQMITAFSALANDGKLMRPTIIDSVIRSNGDMEKTTPYVIDQVITKETSETITAMLTSAVSNGYAKTAKVYGYRIAGKTGTSQIAGPGGKYETGTGSSITSFAGYAPIENPQFTILVKFDRPRNVDYGSESAAPVFKQIAAFLFKYYGIPPDDL